LVEYVDSEQLISSSHRVCLISSNYFTFFKIEIPPFSPQHPTESIAPKTKHPYL
jgi:hypothetical protein